MQQRRKWLKSSPFIGPPFKIGLQQFKRPWGAGRFLPQLGAGPVLHHLTIYMQAGE